MTVICHFCRNGFAASLDGGVPCADQTSMLLDILPLVETPAQAIYWAASLVVFGLAWWRGDQPERTGVLLVLANFVASGLVDEYFWGRVTWGVMIADGLLFAAFYHLALRCLRWWVRVAAAFALLGFLSHFAAMLDASILWWAYVTLRWLISAGILLALVASVVEAPMVRRYEQWRAQLVA